MRGCLISTGCKAAVPGRKRREKKSSPLPNKTCRKQKPRKISEEGLNTCSARRGSCSASQPVARAPAAPLRGQAAGRAAGAAPRGAARPAWALRRRPSLPAPGSHTGPRQLALIPSSVPAAEVPGSAQSKRSGEDTDKAEPSLERLRKKMRVSAGKAC